MRTEHEAAVDRELPAEAGRPGAEHRRHPTGASANGGRVIAEMQDVPTGRYVPLSDFKAPAAATDVFAVLEGSAKSAYLIVAADMLDSHEKHDMVQRVTDAGIQSVLVRAATREIVRIVHDGHRAEKLSTNTEVEEAAWKLIDDGVDSGASDIHIETRGEFAQILFRIHGERIRQRPMSTVTVKRICNVLYTVHADGDNKGTEWDPKTVQDTVIEHTTLTSGRRVQLRFASAPIHPSGNFQAIIRCLVMDEETMRPLEDVGYTQAQVAAIEEMLVGSQGMVLVVGPTNSGKSTSLQAFIERIYKMRGRLIKVETVEDPVEYVLRDACQMGVPDSRRVLEDATGSIYGTFLKGILRHDPDVAMVGEIRDGESADHVKQLVLAGRKLLTTLHVYEVDAVFARLRELGVPESVLFMKGFVSGVVCQRLVPLLCQHCRVPFDEALKMGRVRRSTADRLRAIVGADVGLLYARGDGCQHCKQLGIVGRTPCAELLVPDAQFLKLMAQGRIIEAQQHLAATSGELNIDGMGATMIAHAILKMKNGEIDPADVEEHIGQIKITGGAGAVCLAGAA